MPACAGTRSCACPPPPPPWPLQLYLLVALAQQRWQVAAPAATLDMAKVLSSLRTLTRVQGRTAYVAGSTGGAGAGSVSVQALALLVQANAGVDTQLLSFQAAYTASGPQAAPGAYMCWRAPGGLDAGTVTYALMAYDAKRKSTVGGGRVYSMTCRAVLCGEPPPCVAHLWLCKPWHKAQCTT